MSSDDETEEFSSWKGIPATIMCINAYDPGKQNNTVQVAHTAICRLMRHYLRISKSQLIGVCLFGTEGSNTSVFGLKNVEEVFPLSLPTLDDYKKLRNIDISSLKPAQDFTLSDLLWYCNKAFASCKKQLSSRNVIILSRFDISPIQTDEKPALKRVVDLVDSNIEIRLVNISESDYEINPFYTKFLIEANKGEDITLPKHVWDPKEIEQLMYQQSHRHLVLAHLNFEIGDGLAIGVGVYNLINKTQPKTTDLDRETNAILTRVNKTTKVNVGGQEDMDVDEEEQETKAVPLLKSELLHYQTYGGERVEFTDDEMKMLRNPFGPRMLKLLGFKPASMMCKEKWFLKPSYFLYPNEGVIEGSTVAFNAFYQACRETEKVAICVLCTRVNSKPLLVALSPTTKPLGLNVEIGFDVICVPFIENVRNIVVIEEDEDVCIPEANKQVMKDIINNLKFEFKPDIFENPKLQSQYRAIEAIALEDEEVDPFIDTTKPDLKNFQAIQDELFQELFGPFGAVAVKKVASSREGGPESKKAKVYDSIDENLLCERIDSQKVKDYTVPQLRSILKSKEIPDLSALTGLKKNELVDLVYKHFK